MHDETSEVALIGVETGPEPEEEHGRKERHDAFTAARRKAFVEALKNTGCVLDACRAVGVSDRTAYNWYQADRDFARQWDVALRMASEDIEVAAYERGVIGVEEPVWAYGKLVGTRVRRSDSILRLLLIGSNRKKYGAAARPSARRIARERLRLEEERRARLCPPERSFEEAVESIMSKIDAIERYEAKYGEGSWFGRGAAEGAGNVSIPHEGRELQGGGDGVF